MTFFFTENLVYKKFYYINLKKILTKNILLKHYEYAVKKKYSQHAPGPAKPRIYTGKSTKRGFSKKAITRIEFFFVVLGSYEFLEGLER